MKSTLRTGAWLQHAETDDGDERAALNRSIKAAFTTSGATGGTCSEVMWNAFFEGKALLAQESVRIEALYGHNCVHVEASERLSYSLIW